MGEEGRGRRPVERPAGAVAPAAWPHPAGFHQPVERALGQRDAADRFDLGTGDRLMVGDDRQGFDGSP